MNQGHAVEYYAPYRERALIKHLINTKKVEVPIVESDFSDAEKLSISSMANYINEELKALDEEWEDE